MTGHDDYYQEKAKICESHSEIPAELYDKYDVKKGLRDRNGKGVVTGITNISKVDGYKTVNGVREPIEGVLAYRGYSIQSLVKLHTTTSDFEEASYLLIFGELPDRADLLEYKNVLAKNMDLPPDFVKTCILRDKCSDIMNTMARCVLELEGYDENINDFSTAHVLEQCIKIISQLPMFAVYGYHAYNHYDRDQSLIIHRPDPTLSVAENFLMMLRPDGKYTEMEAAALDTALVIHMEHGGGNNSAFTTRVITSAGSDTYSVIAAALLSLKGPKHGGANIKVVQMIDDIKANVIDVTDDGELENYLTKILKGEAFDRMGLIYGMGHAVYSISDPRAKLLKEFVQRLAKEKGMDEELALYERIERIGPKVISSKRKAPVCINVDYYSGFLYRMLGIPEELYTPLFAIARASGWSAHRIEELISSGKIIRPAYISNAKDREYIPIEKR
ncbi:MAG: citrate synthase [Candidatus Methanomethylophilus sp.]|nr:citrate synthase [Methanomethylophilus sp.]